MDLRKPDPVSGFHGGEANRKLEFARKAGGLVVRKIYVIVSALTRSVSFYGSINWNLTASPN